MIDRTGKDYRLYFKDKVIEFGLSKQKFCDQLEILK